LRVRADLAAGTRRCNCSTCRKRGWWSVAVPLDAVEIVEGAEHVHLGPPNPYWRGRKCSLCDVMLFGEVAAPEAGGPAHNVNVRIFEDVSLHGVPVTWLDGLHDTWAPLGTVPHNEPEPLRV
jgi:hypothetical protein